MDSNTSSVKKRPPVTQNGHKVSQQLKDAGGPTVQEFVATHLNTPPPKLLRKIKTELVKPIKSFKSNKKHHKSYELACDILNGISQLLHHYLKIRENDKLVFIDHHTSNLEYHPDTETSAKPDIGAILQSHLDCIPEDNLAPKAKLKTRSQKEETHQSYYRLPWHLFDSLVELKPRRDAKGRTQVAAYAGFLNQARPDKPGVYCLHISPKEYGIVWSDSSGLSSTTSQWEDITPLAAYVFSLYDPPNDHIKVDTTITLDESPNITNSPRWTVQFQGETYPSCRVLFVGSPWTRQSWIAISAESATSGSKVIKDQYRAIGRRFNEGDIFDFLQDKNPLQPAPGCVYVQCHGEVDGVFTPNKESRRQKKRIIMTTIGKPIYECPTVFEFLKVMYDTLEAHRWIFERKGILHRDISISNILLPTALVKIPEDEINEKRPKFIDEILNPDNVGAASHALLCDFDNACICEPYEPTGPSSSVITPDAGTTEDEKVDVLKRVAGNLKNCTGTPAFIARSVAMGKVQRLRVLPPAMPKLEGEIKTTYESAFSHHALRTYEDPEGQYHGGQLMDYEKMEEMNLVEGLPKNSISHQPCHDAESVFWVIVAFLLRVLPDEAPKASTSTDGEHSDTSHQTGRGRADATVQAVGDGENAGHKSITDRDDPKNREFEVSNPALDALWRPLAEHDIENRNDSRATILTTDQEKWEKALHPKLGFLAPMIMELATHVEPEYSLIRPRPQELHLHEAMQRILFQSIWSMQDASHIPLSGRFRMVTLNRAILRDHTFQPLTGTKRPDELRQQMRKGKKSRRT